jgi:tripartite-type tricarboxylate transporter receptor subunit TctC
MKKHFAFLFAASLLSLSAAAQTTYPSKPVKLMVGAGAGGGTDIIARMLAEKMTESLKGTFIVEHHCGRSDCQGLARWAYVIGCNQYGPSHCATFDQAVI